MDEQIKRIVNRAHPELAGKLHLPVLARVEAISDPSTAEQLSERFRPRYAVDLQVLKESGEPDDLLPVFRSVPLPVTMGGLERGMYGFPEAGAIVELAFAYGLPDRPFIRTVLPDGLSIPAIEPGEIVLQASPGVSQRADAAGNWYRQTDADITDDCLRYVLECYSATETLSEFNRVVRQNSTEEVIGVKTIEALGALKLLSAGTLNVGAVDNLSITTATDHHSTTGRDLKQRIGNIADSLAVAKQLLKVQDGGTMWLGNQSSNVLKILSDLIQVVSDLANTASSHVHGYTDDGAPLKTLAPDQAADFSGQKASAGGLKSTLDPIIEP